MHNKKNNEDGHYKILQINDVCAYCNIRQQLLQVWYYVLYLGWHIDHLKLEMGKNPKFKFVFSLGSLMIRVRFCSGSEYFKQLVPCLVQVL